MEAEREREDWMHFTTPPPLFSLEVPLELWDQEGMMRGGRRKKELRDCVC